MRLRELLAELDRWFPRRIAEPWDNVGLLAGDPEQNISRVMTCLTVTSASAEEAVQQNANLVVTHHPVLFRKVQRLTADGPDRDAYRLISTSTAIYSPHTAYDGAKEGINAQIAERLGLQNVRPIRTATRPEEYKLVVFCPDSDLANVQSALFQAGAGIIGEYSECSYRLSGTGTFRGSDLSHPTIGQKGRREEVSEHRLEVNVPKSKLSSALAAMIDAHSYEEPAYDIFAIEPRRDEIGTGRMGELSAEQPLADLALHVKSLLGGSAVQIVGSADQRCRKIAIGCGSAGELLTDAKRAGCDVFLTGEARFHDCLAAEQLGISLILAGHYATERFALETLADRIANQWSDLTVWPSRSEQDPIQTL